MAHRALIAAGLLATAGPAFAQPAGSYRALGTEPFWSVAIDRRNMTYETPDGRFSVRTPPAQAMPFGRYYRTARLTVRIYPRRPCSDGMSERTYADTVEVVVGTQRLSGCGGTILPPETLADTGWEIVSINGQRVPGGDRYRIEFEANRISGAAGCNRFNGPYRVGRDGMQAGPLTMTRMACPGPAMQHERAVADILRGRVRLSYPGGTSLVIRGEAGEIRLRRLGT